MISPLVNIIMLLHYWLLYISNEVLAWHCLIIITKLHSSNVLTILFTWGTCIALSLNICLLLSKSPFFKWSHHFIDRRYLHALPPQYIYFINIDYSIPLLSQFFIYNQKLSCQLLLHRSITANKSKSGLSHLLLIFHQILCNIDFRFHNYSHE